MGGDGRTARSSGAAAQRLWLCALGFGLAILGSAPAFAGAWTRPAGSGLTITTASHHAFEMSEPGAGFSKIETALYAEYGLSNRLTVLGRLVRETRYHRSVRRISKAGAVYAHSIQTVSQGWGEREVGLRLRVMERRGWTLSSQISALRLPSEPQTGTETPPVWGADARLLLGRNFGSRVFADAQFAQRTQFANDAGERRMDITLGVRPAERWLVMAQTYSAWSAHESGRRSESHRLHLSVIAPVSERLFVQIGAINSFYNDGLSPERAYMLALWREF